MNKLFAIFKKTFKRRQKKTLSLKEQIHFTERLSFLLNSGVSILQSLELIKNQTKNKNRRMVYEKIRHDISEGLTLTQSLRHIFDDFALNIILTGERSGFLSDNISYLTLRLKKKKEMLKNLKQAFVYPLFIAFATIGITVFLILYIFPKILPIVRSLNIELPITTRAVIFVSGVVSHYGILILIVLSILLIIFLILLKKNNKFRFFVQLFSFRIPIIGSIYQDFLLTNFCRNLSLLLKSGLSIDIALLTIETATTNLPLRFHILKLHKFVSAGGRMSHYLLKHPEIFPENFTDLLAVAEETGNILVILINLADFHENQFVEKVKNLSQTVEPVLLIVAGIIVGFVAISIVSPVYEVTHSLQRR
ncbi:MAG: type II secretion system F family protein [Patescibacteria group bacterium]